MTIKYLRTGTYGLVALCLALGLTTCSSGPDDAQSLLQGRNKKSLGERVYRRLMGRGPEPALRQTLNAQKSFEETVRAVLASEDYAKAGFFRLMENQLLLNLDRVDETDGQDLDDAEQNQTRPWAGIARDEAGPGYCSLKMELENVARADRSGPEGFWNLLSYEERWVPLPTFMTDGPLSYCYFGTPMREIRQALATQPKAPAEHVVMTESEFSAQTYALPHVTDPKQRAAICAKALSVEDGYGSLGNEIPALSNLRYQFNQAPDDARSFLATPVGIRFLAAQLASLYGYRNPTEVAFEINPDKIELRAAVDTDCRYKDISADDLLEPGVRGRVPAFSRDRNYLYHWVKIKPSYVYVKARTKGLPGLHGNPYWLSMFPSNEKNGHLHRAKAVFDGYFCQKISPDTANVTEEKPIMPNELVPILGNDQHANASKNCFDCHAIIQPVANFFDGLSYGRIYGQFPSNTVSTIDPTIHYLSNKSVFEDTYRYAKKPSGMWEWTGHGKGHFLTGKTYQGLKGLAATLRNHPQMHACTVERAWNMIFGDLEPLALGEKDTLAKVFAKDGYESMLEAMFTLPAAHAALDPTGWVKAEPEITKEVLWCDDVTDDAVLDALDGFCVGCHSYVMEGDVFEFPRKPSGGTMLKNEEAWHEIYCQVESGAMPKGSRSGMTFDDKRALMCRALDEVGSERIDCGSRSPKSSPRPKEKKGEQ